MNKLILMVSGLLLTGCAGFGVGVGSYESEGEPKIKAWYIGAGVKSDGEKPDVSKPEPGFPEQPELPGRD